MSHNGIRCTIIGVLEVGIFVFGRKPPLGFDTHCHWVPSETGMTAEDKRILAHSGTGKERPHCMFG